MQLAVDASSLVGEVLRARGQNLLSHPQLELVVARPTWDETLYELRQRLVRIARSTRTDAAAAAQSYDEALIVLKRTVAVMVPTTYGFQIDEALRRIPRDPNDAPTVALALALDCGIWTADRDFFGCGVPVWITETLAAHLDAADAP